MSTVICDLDQVAVDNEARAAAARRADGTLDWNRFFQGDLILQLDQVIPAALARLQALAQDHDIWYLTSRQDTCQEATVEFLTREGYPFPTHVLCRPTFTKTVPFKAAAVVRLHAERGPVVLFVDDSEANRAAVAALGIAGLTLADQL